MEARCKICLHYIISEIGVGPIGLLRVLRASRRDSPTWTTDRYTRRPSNRARVCWPRLHSKYINEFTMRALIPNGPTNRSSSGNALSFPAFALVARQRRAGIQDSSSNAGHREITADGRVMSNGSSSVIRSTRDRTFPLGSGFRLSWAVDISSAQAMRKIREAISAGRARSRSAF